MRLISVARAQEGTVLGRDVLIGRADGVPLLRAGVTLTNRYRELLTRAGITAVYIEDEISEGIVVETIIDDVTREVATRAVASAYQSARAALAHGQAFTPATIQDLESVVEQILVQITSAGDTAFALADLSSADGYTFQHSIDVTATGLLVGRRYFADYGWLDFRGERHYDRINGRLSILGLGLLLHDIGKLAVPLSILNKPGKLSAEEWLLMRNHPRAGLDVLNGDQWSPLVKTIVLRHHERWDGSGYPDGKVGEDTHALARIAAVADVFDAMTSERPYAPARPAAEGVRTILEGAGTLFDPEVVASFRNVVAPFPPGTEVALNDGRVALVVSVPDQALDRPVVRIIQGAQAGSEIQLSDEPEFGILGWDHQLYRLPVTA
ncbi:MAG: HD-GYP domain-containing protein [Solirubrobacteraceae bacterium]